MSDVIININRKPSRRIIAAEQPSGGMIRRPKRRRMMARRRSQSPITISFFDMGTKWDGSAWINNSMRFVTAPAEPMSSADIQTLFDNILAPASSTWPEFYRKFTKADGSYFKATISGYGRMDTVGSPSDLLWMYDLDDTEPKWAEEGLTLSSDDLSAPVIELIFGLYSTEPFFQRRIYLKGGRISTDADGTNIVPFSMQTGDQVFFVPLPNDLGASFYYGGVTPYYTAGFEEYFIWPRDPNSLIPTGGGYFPAGSGHPDAGNVDRYNEFVGAYTRMLAEGWSIVHINGSPTPSAPPATPPTQSELDAVSYLTGAVGPGSFNAEVPLKFAAVIKRGEDLFYVLDFAN